MTLDSHLRHWEMRGWDDRVYAAIHEATFCPEHRRSMPLRHHCCPAHEEFEQEKAAKHGWNTPAFYEAIHPVNNEVVGDIAYQP